MTGLALSLLLSAAPAQAKTIQIVAVTVDKVDELARKQLYVERQTGLDKTFGIRPGGDVGGAGVFSARILKPEEVAADPVEEGVRRAAQAQGQDIVFVRTNAKVQLFGSQAVPGGVVGAAVGFRVGGTIEIVETRAVPRDSAGAWEHAKERVFLWPLSAERLRRTLRPGEDLTVTGRLERGTAIGATFGSTLGVPSFGVVGAGVSVSGGHAADEWVSLKMKKTSPDTLRVLLQRGDGKSFSEAVSASAGIDLYDDRWIPTSQPGAVEQTWVGSAVLKGETSLLHKIDDLLKAELSVCWTQARRNTKAEGWGAVHLDDPGQSAALDRLFRFDPDPLRALPPSATYDAALGEGRFESDTREVTDDATLQARLVKLHAVRSAGTSFYELRWSSDGRPPRHFLMGVAHDSFRGDVTNTARDESDVMWYDLATKEPNVQITLGPQKRLFTTTTGVIDDVIAAQKALGVPVEGHIDNPHPYVQVFGLGNYGRTEEDGRFALNPAGVKRVGAAAPEKLVAAYLRADWLYEKESFPPGKNFWGADAPPPWADTSNPDDYRAVYDFLAKNIDELRDLYGPGREDDASDLSWYERKYNELAPGRYLRADARRFAEAEAFARHVSKMHGAADDPEKVIELFLEFKRSGDVELKRAVTATAALAGKGNYQGYIEMTGKNVTLKPVQGAFQMAPTPAQQLASEIQRWD
ncbi:MAG: hypothetical protein KGL53_14630 [Elusimicrobia bacterium]|nr:hypothetical protein [Elusimicrobiota bacterium]